MKNRDDKTAIANELRRLKLGGFRRTRRRK